MADRTQRSVDDHSWMLPIEVMLGSIGHKEVQACSICRVPQKLQKQNEDAYKPKVVAIGPLNRGSRSDLLLMEEPKWQYMRYLLGRAVNTEETTTPEARLKDCGSDILVLDNVVRASYGGNIELEPHELAKVMLLDGCFILELFLRLRRCMVGQNPEDGDYSNDPVLENKEKLFSVLTDLTLLENQIPFIVLKKLYEKIFPVPNKIDGDHRVAELVLNAFGYPVVQCSGVAHLLHLMHSSSIIENQNNQLKQASQELKRCATKLRAAGITIPCTNSNHRMSKSVDRFDFNINLNGGTLKIPPLHIRETTEVNWRNFIALEQSRIGIRCKFTSYALFFQGLVCCEHDVKLLEMKKVIINESKKSREDLLKLFHTITKGVEHMDLNYSELCKSLNKHPAVNPLKKWPTIIWHHWHRILETILFYWKNWYGILVREHIPTVWKFIGVVAAIVLLVLTILQTYYAARSYCLV